MPAHGEGTFNGGMASPAGVVGAMLSQAFSLSLHSFIDTFPTCRSHYLGGSSGCSCRLLSLARPSPSSRRVGIRVVTFENLLRLYSRCGLHTRAVTVYRDTLSEGFSHFVWSLHPLESAAFSRRTPKIDIPWVALGYSEGQNIKGVAKNCVHI
jgi:hypothetical protein